MNNTNARLAGAAVLILALLFVPSCSTNQQGDSATPIYLAVEFTLRTGLKNVNSGTVLQHSTVTLTSRLKNPTGGTSSFLDTRLESYVVEWKRIDGGTKAPATETFGGAVIVPAGGTSTLTDWPFMTASALTRSPLDQLFPFNGGIDRETGNSEIRCLATVTFNGHTMAGQAVQGVGNFDMIFFYQ